MVTETRDYHGVVHRVRLDMPDFIAPHFRPVLDPEFAPAALWNRAYRSAVHDSGGGRPLALALERSDGSVSTFRASILPHEGAHIALNHRYVERLLKFLLWQKGGYRVTVGGDPALAEYLRGIYSPAGARAFDRHFMGRQVYGRPMVIEGTAFDQAPAERETAMRFGPAPGWLPHRVRPGRERPQMRRRGRWQDALQRRNAVEPGRRSRPAVPFRRHQRFAAARRGASAARGCHRRQRRGSSCE